jgi:hypothetical protein
MFNVLLNILLQKHGEHTRLVELKTIFLQRIGNLVLHDDKVIKTLVFTHFHKLIFNNSLWKRIFIQNPTTKNLSVFC